MDEAEAVGDDFCILSKGRLKAFVRNVLQNYVEYKSQEYHDIHQRESSVPKSTINIDGTA